MAEYADTRADHTLVVVVVRFATGTGAQRDLSSALDQPPPAHGRRLAAARIGAASGLTEQPLPGSPTGQLLTLRFRVAALTFLVAVGARQPVDPAAVESIGASLAARAATPPATPPAGSGG